MTLSESALILVFMHFRFKKVYMDIIIKRLKNEGEVLKKSTIVLYRPYLYIGQSI